MSNTLRKPDPSERTSVTLPRSLVRRLQREAEIAGRSASSLVREALEGYFAERSGPGLPPFAGVARSGNEDTSERADTLIRREIEKRHPRRRPRR